MLQITSTVNNINQKHFKKEDVKCFYLFHLKSKFSASLSRGHNQSIVNPKTFYTSVLSVKQSLITSFSNSL